MKKVAIVSCYFIDNYGSLLQAYATQKVLEKLNYDNETINVSGFLKQYRKDQYAYIIKSGIFGGLFRDRLGKAKNLLIKKYVKNEYTRNIKMREKEFARFREKNIFLSKVYSSLDELNSKCSETYSQVLIGSDQLWLPSNIAAGYYTLNFVPENMNSVAYATSFGVSTLPGDMAEVAKKFLPRIKHLSVREESGQKLIEQLTGRRVPVVCDPTMLLTGDEWMDIQAKDPIFTESYIFCYFIGKTKTHREFAKRLAKKTKAKIVAITHVDCRVKADENYADITPYNIGPSEFLNLIRNADYVCTDSYHCSVFSILYTKKFFCFRRYIQDSNQSTNNRLETLFKVLDINDHMLNGDEGIEDCINMQIDYLTVNGKMEKFRDEGYNYLLHSLADSENTDL